MSSDEISKAVSEVFATPEEFGQALKLAAIVLRSRAADAKVGLLQTAQAEAQANFDQQIAAAQAAKATLEGQLADLVKQEG